MPTYDYQCKACGHEFEHFQQMTAPLLRKCPKCGKPKLERLIGTGAGVLFKGGGFYETDYRSDSYTKAAAAEKKSAEAPKTATTKAGDGATESKTAKPEAKAADRGDVKTPPSSDASAGAEKRSARRSIVKPASPRKSSRKRPRRK